ncbi:fibronectin type III domain-containing protein [Acinetobacter baumannii]|uniref:fibronectin type III domain-containing protein n=2 Tax=Acinetobacter baumannii TaxID=470 RepID=UPI0009B6CEBB|nr:fibronectin type III domain-containing protein [Acinetobacter baumannii]MCE6449207.1 fibronectin type III domain-containing protein [Acinetobacter baumannii]MCE6475702.1 fibronectin type III domain-containing protein [Acinetobacter baumannii]MCE6554958.1 fibronectin type III domain-containing protein [Acinetobacter baumannii]MCE6562429.1 fibronectin type III domain-containing protein [Acinetobacter baumannii]MCE6904228.1 fibronectin type III domain-containing protein [Acinetobacter baumanni
MANLVFKFNWDHRPFPYNSAQGKRQFMLPFASGIPNLAPNFSQVQGTAAISQGGTGATTAAEARNNLGAAEKGVNTDITELKGLTTVLSIAQGGTGASSAAGARLVLGLGDNGTQGFSGSKTSELFDKVSVSQWVAALGDNKFAFISNGDWQGGNVNNPLNMPNRYGSLMSYLGSSSYGTYSWQMFKSVVGGLLYYRYGAGNNVWSPWGYFKTSFNTSVDANGFLKSASPVVKLFKDHIELNSDAEKQPIEFKKVDVGDYLLKGSLGFAQEGWYIEVPKDANGNTIVAVVYDTLENGDLSIKTYKRKFDFELAAVVADLEIPTDIPEGRWIDIRLHEEPEPEPEPPTTETPFDFQPTNLSEAVAAAMVGVEPPEISDTDETL